MKVSQFSNLIEHLASGLEPVVAAGVTADLRALQAALVPFADRTVADFVKFVGQCEEYQRTGVVAGGGKAKGGGKKAASDPERAARSAAAIQGLLSEMDRGEVGSSQIEAVLSPLQSLAKPELDEVLANLKIAGKSKSKPDAINRIRQILNNQAEAASRVMTMREDR